MNKVGTVVFRNDSYDYIETVIASESGVSLVECKERSVTCLYRIEYPYNQHEVRYTIGAASALYTFRVHHIQAVQRISNEMYGSAVSLIAETVKDFECLNCHDYGCFQCMEVRFD